MHRWLMQRTAKYAGDSQRSLVHQSQASMAWYQGKITTTKRKFTLLRWRARIGCEGVGMAVAAVWYSTRIKWRSLVLCRLPGTICHAVNEQNQTQAWTTGFPPTDLQILKVEQAVSEEEPLHPTERVVHPVEQQGIHALLSQSGINSTLILLNAAATTKIFQGDPENVTVPHTAVYTLQSTMASGIDGSQWWPATWSGST
jgi:hypothetical protein